VKGGHVGDVELSAAEALVAVGAHPGAHAAMPFTSSAPQVSTEFVYQHSVPSGAGYAAPHPSMAYSSAPGSAAGYSPHAHGGHHQPPPYAYMHHQQHIAAHSHASAQDAFYQPPSYSMPTVRSTHSHSGARSVISAHSHHSGAGGPMRHGAPHFAHGMPGHGMHRVQEYPAMGPVHPALAASAACRWHDDMPEYSTGPRRYAPGSVTGQLRR